MTDLGLFLRSEVALWVVLLVLVAQVTGLIATFLSIKVLRECLALIRTRSRAPVPPALSPETKKFTAIQSEDL